MNKSILTMILLAAPALAGHDSLLERYAGEYRTPRKTEQFVQSHYQRIQDQEPWKLNTTEEFLTTGQGDEKEVVNAAADMLRKNGYAVHKMFYRTASGIERYFAYIEDPPQRNNYIFHIGIAKNKRLQVMYIDDGHGHKRLHIAEIEELRLGPALVTDPPIANLTDAKGRLQRYQFSYNDPVVFWGRFEHNSQSPDGMRRYAE